MVEPANRNKFAAILFRDPAVTIMFAIALLLIVLLPLAGAVFARTGHPELLMAALLATGTFAVVGMVLGLVRGLGSERAIRKRSAHSDRFPPVMRQS